MSTLDTSGLARPGDPAATQGRTESVTTVTMSFDPLSEDPGSFERADFEGRWDGDVLVGTHMVDGVARAVRVSRSELVRLSLGWVPDGKGNATRFVVQGRCLSADADALAARVREGCRVHASAMLSGYARIAGELDRGGRAATAGSAPATRVEPRLGVRTTPNPLDHARPEVAHDYPAGRYWVADPCMVLDQSSYDEYLAAGGHGAVGFEFRGRHTCVAGTEHGDGTHGCDLGDVDVESGRVGILDVATVDALPDSNVHGFVVEATHGMRVEFSRGRLDIGVHGPSGTEWHRVAEPEEERDDEEGEGEGEDEDGEDKG